MILMLARFYMDATDLILSYSPMLMQLALFCKNASHSSTFFSMLVLGQGEEHVLLPVLNVLGLFT